MDQEKKKQLEEKLRSMFENSKQPHTSQGEKQSAPMGCNIIRRRKGEQDKRIH
jgi:hypothetical protein